MKKTFTENLFFYVFMHLFSNLTLESHTPFYNCFKSFKGIAIKTS